MSTADTTSQTDRLNDLLDELAEAAAEQRDLEDQLAAATERKDRLNSALLSLLAEGR